MENDKLKELDKWLYDLLADWDEIPVYIHSLDYKKGRRDAFQAARYKIRLINESELTKPES